MNKKIILIFMLVFVVGNISAFEFDNIKTYDKSTKTATINNAFGLGGKITDVTLLSPQHNKVIPNDDVMVAHFKFYPQRDYNNILNSIRFINLNTKEEEQKEFTLKYLNLENFIVQDSICEKATFLNGTEYCNWVESKSSHLEQKEVWREWDKNVKSDNSIDIGIFTSVEEGDYYEWIPTIAGVEVVEWADFTGASLYEYDTTGSTAFDFFGTSRWFAQCFTPGNTGANGGYDIVGVQVKLAKTNSPAGNAVVMLWASNESANSSTGAPTGSVLSGGTVAMASLNTTPYFYNITLNTSYSIVADTQYCLTMNAPNSDSGNRIIEYRATADNYNGGACRYSTDGGSNFAVCSVSGQDSYFQVWGTSPIVKPTITLYDPIEFYNTTNPQVNFTGSAILYGSDSIGNVSLYVDESLLQTNSSGINNTNYTFTGETFSDGNHNWNYYSCDTSNNCQFGTNRTFSVDTLNPSLSTGEPININYQKKFNNLALYWNVSDANIDTCTLQVGGANTSVTCGDNTTNINITSFNNQSAIIYANDTFNRNSSATWSWNYLLFLDSQYYNSSVGEGTINTFTANFSTNGTDINIARLNYNGTNYTANIQDYGNNNYTTSRVHTAPIVDSDASANYFWVITQGSYGTQYTASKSQTVTDFSVDNCSTNTVLLYNFTIANEETEGILNQTNDNTFGEVDLQLYSYGGQTSITNFSNSYNQTNPFSVCINETLSGGNNYNINVQVQYSADSYETEFYNIQNSTINSSSIYNNITLYDLLSSDSQIFSVSFKDSSYLPVADALIHVYRKYISNGTFLEVEAPLTDAQGSTVVHLVVNTVVYNFVVTKYGVTLGTFSNLNAECQNPTLNNCALNFNALSESINIPNYQQNGDFNYTLGYNTTTRVISSTFVIPSGDVSLVTLNVSKEDALGTSICSDLLSSTSGSLSCNVGTTFGNTTVIAKLYKDGNLAALGNLKLDQNPTSLYGVNLAVLGMFVFLTLIGAGMSGNPIFTILFFMVGVILLFALNLVANNGFIGGTATILFLIIAIIIVIIKGARRN